MKMKMKKLQYGPDAEQGSPERAGPSTGLIKSVLFASLLLALGTLFLNMYLEENLEAHGDRAHLANPAGPDQMAALRFAGQDPTQLNPNATQFLGTGWLQGLAMLSGLIAFLASAWLCAAAASREVASREVAPREGRGTGSAPGF